MSAAIRFRRVLASQGLLIAAVLAMVAVGAFAGAWVTYANPPTETIVEQRNPQTVSTAVNTSAVVTGETPLYDEGERLVNKPVYFTEASPNVTISVVTQVPSGQPVQVTQRLVLHMQGDLRGETYWEETTVLAASDRAVTDGRAVASTTVNVSAIRETIDERESATGSVGVFQSDVELLVAYEGEGYSGELTSEAPVVFSSGAFWLDADLAASRTHSEQVTREVAEEPDIATYGGLALLGLLALGGAAAVALTSLGGIDPEELETAIANQRYEEWISKGEFPTGTEKKYVKIDSLEDLVDIAIDSNKRVVFDPEFAAYAVVDGDLIYYFSTDPLRIDSWLDV